MILRWKSFGIIFENDFNASMRILMVIPELTTGGAQRSFSQLANDLASDNEVYVVVFNQESIVQYPIQSKLYSLDVIPGKGWFGKIIAFFSRIRGLKAFKHNIRPDVCISFLEGADYVNVLSKGNERTIISVRGPKNQDLDMEGCLGLIRKKVLIPFLYRRADKVVAVSSFIQEQLIKDYRISNSNIQVIGNYYDIQLLREQSEEDLPERYRDWVTGDMLVNVGRLHKGKNQTILLDSFAELHKSRDCKLGIIGDGPLRNELLRHARGTNLRVYSHWDNEFNDGYDIYFFGEQGNVLPFIRKSAVFVFPSLYEGFPNVLIEAMVCGIPILSSQCEGSREVLGPIIGELGGGLLKARGGVIVFDAPRKQLLRSWVEGMKLLLDSREARDYFKMNGILRAEEFRKSMVLTKWMEEVHVSD